MARPDPWDRTHYLSWVIGPDKEVALDRAMEEFRIGAANRFRLIAEPVEEES